MWVGEFCSAEARAQDRQEEGGGYSLLWVLLNCHQQRSNGAYCVQTQDWPLGEWAGGDMRYGLSLGNLTV